MGVGVAVVVVVGADGFELGRGGTAVGGFAAADLELDGGVGDVEPVAQSAVDGVEDAGAVGDGHLRDEDVAGEAEDVLTRLRRLLKGIKWESLIGALP